MKHIIWLLAILIWGISTNVTAQDTVKDTTAIKDTTFINKLGTLVQYVIMDTVPRQETKNDSLLEKKYIGKVYSFRQFEHETFLFARTPIQWHSKDWIRVGLVVVLTGAIMPFDQYISNVTQGHQSNYYLVPVILGRIYGSWYFNVATIGASTGYTIFTHNREAEKIDIELIQAGIYSELIAQALKVGIGRASPYENRGAFNFLPFNFKKGFGSMPNGSATSAFALSTITFRHANSTLFKILAYVPAAFTLFSGIYQNTHWASDEFLGSAIGFGTGMWVVTLHEGKRHKINILADK
jgi:membrane-associated phospholipid phosphatase